jgi:hypothetical protein
LGQVPYLAYTHRKIRGIFMAMQGYVVAIGIKGYTSFLTQSELEHASDILKNLFTTLIDSIQPPLQVSNLQGEILLGHIPQVTMLHPQTLIELVETLYFSFAQQKELMITNTTCTCTACCSLPLLDLRFVVHAGEYLENRLQGQKVLSGASVLLVNAMLEYHLHESPTNVPYAIFTSACNLGETTLGMQSSEESYENFGMVSIYGYPLEEAWQHYRDTHRHLVSLDNAWYDYELVLPVSPSKAWDYVNQPEYQRLWRNADRVKMTNLKQGRVGIGATLHCMHGRSTITGTILDWRPFEYVTTSMQGLFNSEVLLTIYLQPIENGTRLHIVIAEPIFHSSARHFKRMLNKMGKSAFRKNAQQGSVLLLNAVQNETQSTYL